MLHAFSNAICVQVKLCCNLYGIISHSTRQAKREQEQKAKVDSRTGGNLDFDFDGDDTKAI